MSPYPLLLLLLASSVASYKILCVFPVPSHSHNTLGKGVVRALLDAGHEVTYATVYPEKDLPKNLKIIEIKTKYIVEAINMMEHRSAAGINIAKDMGRNITKVLMSTPAFRDALVHEQFDAVVTEWFFNDVQAGIAAIQRVPWLLVNGMVVHPHLEGLIDQIQSPGIVPAMMNDFGMPMTFVERVKNTMMVTMMMLANTFIDQPASETLYNEIFTPLAQARGVPLAPYYDALYNLSAVIINSHPSIAHAQSLPPNAIEVAGYHLDEVVQPLPKDLQTLLDNSPQGVVYFSMGSVLKSASFPVETRRQLLQIFARLRQTVLWKFEDTDVGDLPKNVHVRTWLPQQSILAHPNVRVFVTHGGMLSSIEAIHHGVPILAVPMFGDQPANAARAVRRGYALSVPYSPDMAQPFGTALDEMLNNDGYYKTAKKLSKAFRLRPVAPSKLIAYYTELAIETGGALHLRSKALLYPWYKRLLLDQLCLLIAIVAVIVIACKRIFKREKKGGKQKKN